MIVDTSVIIALLREEPEARSFTALMARAGSLRMSSGTRVEINVVTARNAPHLTPVRIERTITRLGIGLVPVSARQVAIADEGYRRFGKGSGHAAKLNFGDCFAYALAKELNEPLLFKGEDFIHTDVEPAAPR